MMNVSKYFGTLKLSNKEVEEWKKRIKERHIEIEKEFSERNMRIKKKLSQIFFYS